jgi:hypothetical protein
MKTKDLLNIKNQRLDYRIPSHKLLTDILTEYYNGPKLLQGDYIFSVSILDDEVYVERSQANMMLDIDKYNNKISGGLLFPAKILDSDNPVKLAKVLGLNNILSDTVNRLAKLEQELLALELQKQQIEQELIENAY